MNAVTLTDRGVCLRGGRPVAAPAILPPEARNGSIAASILASHDLSGGGDRLRIRFDALVSHDITYVGIIQTARAAGLSRFPVPYALTNCHNSLCAVGGTINEDDHEFGLSAARKYGGIFVPPHAAVIHAYAREVLAGCGRMILGSDSHTRYGPLGTLGIGEGGPEIVKQLLSRAYDLDRPGVVLVYLRGAPRHGVGPHDVALAIIGAVFPSGFARNRILEFVGPGVAALPMDFRNGIDVMTTETACLSSIWVTDGTTERFLTAHGRREDYRALAPADGAYYDGMIDVDLSAVEPMIALPFHPSNVCSIHEFTAHAAERLAAVEEEAGRRFGKTALSLRAKIRADGGVQADQGVIAGCAGGTFDNLDEAAAVLAGGTSGRFPLSVYPASAPVALELTRVGRTADLLAAGAVVHPPFCGPCFGACDTPANNGLSLRHTTRNFPNREGSKPSKGQLSCVALMDARSIAATARNGGRITAATDVDYAYARREYRFDGSIYERRVYNGFGRAEPSQRLVYGPGITDWPRQYPLSEHLLLEVAAVIRDPVTTTDELIPSGETSSYRSNPERLASFTLSRRCPDYVARARSVLRDEEERRNGRISDRLRQALDAFGKADALAPDTRFGSCIYANRPGDGSAREQAASCQKVLGGLANICVGYATARYRANCVNWGILPFTVDGTDGFPYGVGDLLFVPHIRRALVDGRAAVEARVRRADGSAGSLTLRLSGLTPEERSILLAGCLANHYAAQGT